MNTQPLSDIFPQPPEFPADTLSFVSLGGCGEFGNNFQVLHYNGEFLLIDCGFGFADDRFPGVDITLPSPSFLVHVKNKIKGMVITHAHDDHIGAIGALWPQLNCPIYATPLPSKLIAGKLAEWGAERRATINVVPLESRIKIGAFDVEWINAAHSVPETSMLFIRTPVGNILHTADWRIDAAPMVGQMINLDRLREIGEEGIDAVLAESTNAGDEYVLDTEESLTDGLTEQFLNAKGMVVVGCLASRVARIYNVCVAAKRAGRTVGLLGRSLWRFFEATQECGYMTDLPSLLTPKELKDVPRNKLVVIATGCQGEKNAALDRMARREHHQLEFLNGDTALFSARQIPGNEKDILRLQGWLTQQGVRVITPEDAPIHVSGHATAPDMRILYNILKPKALLPVHGDVLNQMQHAALARECGIPVTLMPHNGDIIAIDNKHGVGVVGHVETGLLAIDGDRVVPITDNKLFKQRRAIGEAGHIVVTLIIDNDYALLNDPVIAAQGVVGTPEENDWLHSELTRLMEKTLKQMAGKMPYRNEIWAETIRVAIRQFLTGELGKKPIITVQLIKL